MVAKRWLNNLKQNSNSVFCFLRRMKKEGKNLEGQKCLRGRDEPLGFIKKDWANIWKKYMKNIMNSENKWDHMVETDLAEEPMACIEICEKSGFQRNCESNAKDEVRKGNWTIWSDCGDDSCVSQNLGESDNGTMSAYVEW